MIQANELRIGSWILLFGKPAKLGEVNSELIKHQDAVNVGAIPLTPELLSKAGFKQRERIGNWDTYIAHVNGDISLNNNNGCYFKNQRLERRVDYLHQLQLVVFSLTGREIEIDFEISL